MACEPKLEIEKLLAIEGLCTAAQEEKLRAILEHGSIRSAARAAGQHHRRFTEALHRARTQAARLGHAEGHFNSGVAPGYIMGKVTIARNKNGEVERTWERQSPDDRRVLEAMQAAIAALCDEVPRVAPTPTATTTLRDLLTLYTFTDFHLGMLAWHREGGADWDVDIAERLGNNAMASMVASAPCAEEAIVNIQGDFLHSDGLDPVTPTSKHVLDADSRFGKVVQVAIRLIRSLVMQALGKHARVRLIIAEGNHDIIGSLWMRHLFTALFEHEPRVMVENADLPYCAVRFGRVMLGFHHGHLKKNASLPALFAAQFRQMWGECVKVYIHTGHRHHREIIEHAGAEVIQHPTIAARDAYAARGGWMAERRMTAITYHAEHGEVGTSTVTPEMFGA